MARILYGVMGDAGGHVNRARIVAREMRRHEFLFVGGGRTHDLKGDGYSVENLPMGSTIYKGNRVDIVSTALNAVKVFALGKPVVERLSRMIREFDPHLILSDYEYFTPRAARLLGRPCVSLDHQHVLTLCDYNRPSGQFVSGLMTKSVIRAFYSGAGRHMIVSFFRARPKDPSTTEIFPAILRREITRLRPSEGDHALVYQTSPTFNRLIPLMQSVGRLFYVYGFGSKPTQGNIVYKAPSKQGFLDDLASCRYVITNGGHNVISEALYLGKPVLSFPISGAYEQYINGGVLSVLGYGDCHTSSSPTSNILKSFEDRLFHYRMGIQGGMFFGNDLLTRRLENLINNEESGSHGR